MKLLFDTSALVAAMVEPHPGHGRALSWLKRAIAGEHEFLVASHSLAEIYAVLTAYPLRPRISPETARRLIRQNVEDHAKIIGLFASDYRAVILRMSELGLIGGVIYDALIARAAQKASADRLLTFNIGDFERVWPEGSNVLAVP